MNRFKSTLFITSVSLSLIWLFLPLKSAQALHNPTHVCNIKVNSYSLSYQDINDNTVEISNPTGGEEPPPDAAIVDKATLNGAATLIARIEASKSGPCKSLEYRIRLHYWNPSENRWVKIVDSDTSVVNFSPNAGVNEYRVEFFVVERGVSGRDAAWQKRYIYFFYMTNNTHTLNFVGNMYLNASTIIPYYTNVVKPPLSLPDYYILVDTNPQVRIQRSPDSKEYAIPQVSISTSGIGGIPFLSVIARVNNASVPIPGLTVGTTYYWRLRQVGSTVTAYIPGPASGYTIPQTLTLCQDGSNDQVFSSSMVGCDTPLANLYTLNQAAEACVSGTHICSLEEYMAQGGKTTFSSQRRWLSSTAGEGFLCPSNLCILDKCAVSPPSSKYPLHAVSNKTGYAASCSQLNNDNVGYFQTSSMLGGGFDDIPSGTMCCINTPTTASLPNIPTQSSSDIRVFVTSTTYDGNLGGLAGADAKCQAAADDPNKDGNTSDKLGGIWKAWLSGTSISVVDRITRTSGKYKLLDDTIIAQGWTDLTDDSLLKPIDITESNTKLSTARNVWTGTSMNNLSQKRNPFTDNCLQWSSGRSEGIAGNTSFSNSAWTSKDRPRCSTSASLYCFEKPADASVALVVSPPAPGSAPGGNTPAEPGTGGAGSAPPPPPPAAAPLPCGSGTAKATGLVSTFNLPTNSNFGTTGACIVDPKAAFAPFKIPTFEDLKSLYYDQKR